MFTTFHKFFVVKYFVKIYNVYYCIDMIKLCLNADN